MRFNSALPLWMAMISCTSASPSPAPGSAPEALARKKRSKTRAWSSVRMPIPWSVTAMPTASPAGVARCRMRKSMATSPGECL